jgi:alkylation response protein AidB-like acyl-CoA dehydrogenase
MDFSWSEDQQTLRQAMLAFASSELNEGLIERDKAAEFNRDGWLKCAKMGVHGLPVPQEWGGSGCDALTTVGALESFGYGCKDNGLAFSINAHMWTNEIPLLDFGTPDQKKRYLPGLVGGEIIGGNAMSEPGSGSDAYALRTTAEKKGDRYVLNGSKVFVSNGPVADLVLVFATVDKAKGKQGVTGFLVERKFAGFTVAKKMDKMGIRTSPMAELFFDNCEVPEENRLGREGSGQALFTHSMNWERACLLASAVGSMQRILDTCVRYAKERKQFGKSIDQQQLVQDKLVGMKMRIEASRFMLYKAAWLLAKGKSIFSEAAMAKLQISESWVAVARDAIQIHGGYGYMVEYEMERELRDAIGSTIYSGTSEIQKLIIAPMLGM